MNTQKHTTQAFEVQHLTKKDKENTLLFRTYLTSLLIGCLVCTVIEYITHN